MNRSQGVAYYLVALAALLAGAAVLGAYLPLYLAIPLAVVTGFTGVIASSVYVVNEIAKSTE